ncbi:MAG: LLM class flavin-dependent oxidoreductase [Candidatus Binatia bacterium]|nr:LLM class flavin-dependent oxidoreductase [Candidatus Binatia bacterium]
MKISCGFPPTKNVVEHARQAEGLGFDRAWIFDSPALYGDLWIAVARVAEGTKRIGVGTAVAVPNLRHVLVTASAIASVEELAPGRLACAFGTGFTARLALGQKALTWKYTRRYIEQLRALLRGETVVVDGGACQMIHSPGFAPTRPIETPLLVAAMGPKGTGIAKEIGDGVMSGSTPIPDFDWSTLVVSGTVLESGEDHTTPRVIEAAGPWFVTSYHGIFEMAPDMMESLPGGPEWRAGIEAERPEGERHLALHEGHVVAVSDRDRPLIESAGPALLDWSWTGDRSAIRAKLDEAKEAGATEILYSPSGPDVPRELDAFANAVLG